MVTLPVVALTPLVIIPETVVSPVPASVNVCGVASSERLICPPSVSSFPVPILLVRVLLPVCVRTPLRVRFCTPVTLVSDDSVMTFAIVWPAPTA